jgi:hypothetical protein
MFFFRLLTFCSAHFSALVIVFEWQSVWKNRKVGDLSGFERGQRVGTRAAGASVTKPHIIRCIESKSFWGYVDYTNHGKTTSAKRNSGRKSKLTDRCRHTLRTIVLKNLITIAARVTVELNVHHQDLISTKTVRHEFHTSNIHGRAEIAKPLFIENNIQMRKRWCHDHKTWISDN